MPRLVVYLSSVVFLLAGSLFARAQEAARPYFLWHLEDAIAAYHTLSDTQMPDGETAAALFNPSSSPQNLWVFYQLQESQNAFHRREVFQKVEESLTARVAPIERSTVFGVTTYVTVEPYDFDASTYTVGTQMDHEGHGLAQVNGSTSPYELRWTHASDATRVQVDEATARRIEAFFTTGARGQDAARSLMAVAYVVPTGTRTTEDGKKVINAELEAIAIPEPNSYVAYQRGERTDFETILAFAVGGPQHSPVATAP